MSRPVRGDRQAARGRPKRLAAKTHFFKYQLAANPTRAEENDLKRALQESLEEQHNQSKTKATKTPNAAKNHRVNSANSTGNNKSNNTNHNTTSNAPQHNHSSVATTTTTNSNTTTTNTKTASATSANTIVNTTTTNNTRTSNSNKNKATPQTLLNKTSKRPIAKKQQQQQQPIRQNHQSQSLALFNGKGGGSSNTKKGSDRSDVINNSALIKNHSIIIISSTNNSDVSKSNNSSSSSNGSINSNPVIYKRNNDCSLSQDQTIYLSSHQFKASLTSTPIIIGKGCKVSSSDANSSNSSGIGIGNESSSNGVASGSSNIDNNMIVFNNLSDPTSASVRLTKKRSPLGSWSLLGVPEEKVIYLRDDDPPRRLICYPAIKHVEGDVIKVRDSVLLRSGARKTDLPYIAKVCAFWEDAETGSVMMSLFWYYRPEHTEEGRKPHHLPDEIFASRHRDVDSVECIEDLCYVLTFNEYCRYRKRCKMEQVNTNWSLTDVTIPVSNESYPRRSRIPDSEVNPELVFCCRQVYDAKNRRLAKNPFINPKYGYI